MRKNKSVRNMAFAAVIAAVYAVLTVVLPIPQYGAVQIRFAEALTVLPFFFPAATPGLFVGCVIANLFSPFPLDIIFGSLATLLACFWTRRMPNRWLAPLPPVLCNAVIVGFEIKQQFINLLMRSKVNCCFIYFNSVRTVKCF